MAQVFVSDYFYGDESKEFSYFRIPRLLITHQRFKNVSVEAKLLYGLLLDRMGLSEEHGWYDEDGRVFIYYTVEEIADDLCCGRDKAMKLLAELGFGYGLLVLFFAMGVFRSAASFRELQRSEFALRHFIRFLLAKVAVGSSLELITAIYKICGGVVSTVMGGIGSAISTMETLPDKIVEAIEDVSFLESIPLWLVSLLGSLLITVLSFVLILTVYGRFFKIFIYTAIAPLPLASFAGEATSRTGQTFLKSYVGVCMEGAVIVLSCVIYSAFLSGGSTALDESLPAATMVWQYLGQLMFNMLVLTGLVKGSDRLVHEMLGA